MNKSVNEKLNITKGKESDFLVALAGNPNVGKSTLFNELTGLNQHTGNWPGKTVGTASGRFEYGLDGYVFVDLPGTYSLLSHSAEEEVASGYLCFGGADAAVIVSDATCLERNLNLALQTIEITSKAVLCVNLIDEAKRKNIEVNLEELSDALEIPVVAICARNRQGIDLFMQKLQAVCKQQDSTPKKIVRYPAAIETAIETLCTTIPKINRHVAIRLLDCDDEYIERLCTFLSLEDTEKQLLHDTLLRTRQALEADNITLDMVKDKITACLVLKAQNIAARCVKACESKAQKRDRTLDKILTGKWTGIPIMLLLLCGVLWLTIQGANYPSQLLSAGLFWIEDRLAEFFTWISAPLWLKGILVDGMYHTLAWVTAVMLPPMAIFFPLFTILEDFGYLPRVAFNLDHSFKKAHSCGKQALTMCMGFGCNAAGVVGCRIIDSPRERLLALLTNVFVPCNGRFPTLIAIITMFFVGVSASFSSSILSSLLLTGVILLGVFLTFLISRILSATLLKGVPSSFTLELPPYRKPQIGKVIVRSIFDRTLFVLARAAAVAAPAGAIIWIMANVTIADQSLLLYCCNFLDPFARFFGLDGVILFAFILGLPANEIVVPIIIMAYCKTGVLVGYDNVFTLKTLLVDNGWTVVTAISTMLFCLCHWPCSTTCMSIHKETHSAKWTLASILTPTIAGFALCFCFTTIARLCGLQ